MFEAESDTVKAYNIITNMYLYGVCDEYTCNGYERAMGPQQYTTDTEYIRNIAYSREYEGIQERALRCVYCVEYGFGFAFAFACLYSVLKHTENEEEKNNTRATTTTTTISCVWHTEHTNPVQQRE